MLAFGCDFFTSSGVFQFEASAMARQAYLPRAYDTLFQLTDAKKKSIDGCTV